MNYGNDIHLNSNPSLFGNKTGGFAEIPAPRRLRSPTYSPHRRTARANTVSLEQFTVVLATRIDKFTLNIFDFSFQALARPSRRGRAPAGSGPDPRGQRGNGPDAPSLGLGRAPFDRYHCHVAARSAEKTRRGTCVEFGSVSWYNSSCGCRNLFLGPFFTPCKACHFLQGVVFQISGSASMLPTDTEVEQYEKIRLDV